MESILLNDLISENNRKYTKDDGFEQLLNSVREYGIIEPPVVRRTTGGGFRVVAGRRRVEAARRLEFSRIDCVVREPDDPVDDEEIALSENVNRADMHPLDEAAAFKRMADEGNTVEEIARYYARSPSAIYKRLRLAGLIEELRGLFRDGALNISGAAVLAELPEEDQRKFHKQRQEDEAIDAAVITRFVHKAQRFKIRDCMGEGCRACGKRTHNGGNDLFQEFAHLDDVCLEGDCYRAKWHELINEALAEKVREAGLRTDNKIYFRSDWSGGIPELLYKQANYVEFGAGQETAVRFEVLRDKEYEFTGKTEKKTGACWQIGEGFEGLFVTRVGYKRRAPRERDGKNDDGTRLVDSYGREEMEYAAREHGTTAAELAQALKSKIDAYNFQEKIEKRVYERVTAERIREERPRDYLSLFMRYLEACNPNALGGSFVETEFNAAQKKLFTQMTGKKSLKELSVSDEAQKLFHFLLLNFEFLDDVPSLKGIENAGKNSSFLIFLDYAGLDAEGYKTLYLDAARETVDNILKPAVKTRAPSPATGKRGRPAKGNKEPAEVKRRCRICGCTDDDCSQCIEKTGEACYWVEADLCSACAAEAAAEPEGGGEEADEYPFRPDIEEDEDPGIGV